MACVSIFMAKQEALTRATDAAAFIKPEKNTSKKNFEEVLRRCIEDQSIGISYGIFTDITKVPREELATAVKQEVIRRQLPFAPQSPTRFREFIYDIKIGDIIIIGQGTCKCRFVATISSECFFDETRHDILMGNKKHRRRLTNIMELPEGTVIAKGSIPTIKMRQPGGWGIQ